MRSCAICVSMLCFARFALLPCFLIAFLPNVGADKSIELEDSTLPVESAGLDQCGASALVACAVRL